MTDVLTLIAHHATLATEPHALPSPAPSVELDSRRRDAQRRFDVDGLPRGLRTPTMRSICSGATRSLMPRPRGLGRADGLERHPTKHYGYVLHSHECRDGTPDLRDCPFSLALDLGIEEERWDAG